jgi:hypothetical protein
MANYPAIPDPTTEVESLQASMAAAKQFLEILSGQKGIRLNAAVTWQDLVDLGLIKPDRVNVTGAGVNPTTGLPK